MAKKSIGLKSIKIGAIAGDGGMGATLTQIGATVSDTAGITTAEGSTTDFKIEESDSPFYSLVSDPGKKTFAWSCYDVDPANLVKLLGGSVDGTTGAWAMPDTIPDIEQSIEITTKDLWVIRMPRASVTGRLQWNLQKTKLAQVDMTATILVPTKANTAAATFTPPA